MRARRISLAAVVAALMAGCVVAVAPAAAAVDKPYSLVLSPSSVASGAQATISARYTNLTSQQQLGSSNLTAPAGFSVLSATVVAPAQGTATVSGSTVQLRSLSLPPGGSVTVSVSVRTPCSAGTFTWSAATKQANNFSGPPGNDLNLEPSQSSMTTTTTGACALRFTTQPRDVQTGSPITGSPLNPSGPPVAVSVVDGAGNPTSAAVPITVGLGASPSGAALSGTKTVTSTNGTASFSNLSVDKPGTYTLVASTSGLASTTSGSFRADQGTAICENNVDCNVDATVTGVVPGTNKAYSSSAQISSPQNTDSSIGDDGGAMRLSFNVDYPLFSCSGYSHVTADREVFTGPERVKFVTSRIGAGLLKAAGRKAASLEVCFVAPYPFSLGPPVASNTSAPVGDLNGDGMIDYKGLLPDCLEVVDLGFLTVLVGPPCVVSRSTNSAGDAIIVYKTPASSVDPAGRY